MNRIVEGALSGLLGTSAMTVFMLAGRRSGLGEGRLAPKEVSRKVERTIGIRDKLPNRVSEWSWVPEHFGYGTNGGIAYALMQRALNADNPMLSGPLYGIGLYAIGYAGWLPLLGIYPPPTGVPKRKLASIVLAHIVYGTTTAAAYHRLGVTSGHGYERRKGDRHGS